MAGSSGSQGKVAVLDPYTCIPKRNRKYASECTEVYLSKQGAEKISEDFSHFTNLEVIWFNANRLSRIENLEHNFRIREVYIEDNRLVSLSGLKPFKFLRVLLAGDNQLRRERGSGSTAGAVCAAAAAPASTGRAAAPLAGGVLRRNLDKQLALLSKFAFLRKLELFGNPIAEEPDYRLRVIYHAPQVELLDQHGVKELERVKADEVVPNLDKVSPNRPKPKKEAQEHSFLERSCFKMATEIRERRRREEDALLSSHSFQRSMDLSGGLPLPKRFLPENRLDPTKNFLKDLAKPSQLEKYEMRPLIEKKAGKPELTREEVTALCQDLAREGVDEVGRVLATGDVLKREAAAAAGGPAHVVEKLLDDPEAAVPTSEVANWLLTLEWPHPDGQDNDRRIKQAYEDARRAEKAGDAENLATCRTAVLRLTRGHSYVGPPMQHSPSGTGGTGTRRRRASSRHSVLLDTSTEGPGARGDFFKQTFLRPCRSVDAAGRAIVAVNTQGKHTVLGGNLPALA